MTISLCTIGNRDPRTNYNHCKSTLIVNSNSHCSLLVAIAPASIIKAVVKQGADQYFAIGRELGLNASKINDTVSSIPTFSGKLLAIIERQKSALGEQKLAEELLAACKRIDNPIYENVLRQLNG